MAKNLKLTIKNVQLAEALNLSKLKKPSSLKKKKPSEEEEKGQPAPLDEEKAEKPAEPVKTAPEPMPSQAAKVEEVAPVAEEPPAPIAAPKPVKSPLPEREGRRPLPQPLVRPGIAPYTPPPRKEYHSPPPQKRPYPADTRPEIKKPTTAPKETVKTETNTAAKVPAKTTETEEAAAAARKKGPGFKEYRDIKPLRKPEQRATFDSRDRQGLRDRDDQEWRKRRPSQKQAIIQEETIRPKNLSIRLPISVKDLAVEMKLKASQLISTLFMQGVTLTLNDFLDDETTIQLLGNEFDCQITIDTKEEQRIRITDRTIKQEIGESDGSSVIIRPPVVTFMGHVDHGKTSLIDAIRKTNIAAGEAGAITQHIGAFKCHTAVGDITILDTPGHEAFSAMRTRGAEVTDIVVLVIAGDEGIRPQTLEAIKQSQEAAVSLVIAINKSDKPNFNAENVYKQLAENNLLPEVWGGTVITVNCSAVSGAGIKELLEMLALQAEILELKANPQARARGTVIESEMHKGMGGVATLLVQNGSLRLGDSLVFAEHWARVKTMQDEKGKDITTAGPSTPVKVTGLSGLPEAGSEFIAVKNENEARELAHKRSEGQKKVVLQQAKRAGVEGLLQQKAESAERKTLNLIVRADVQGSLEAIKTSLLKIHSDKVGLNIISSGIGEISESDIQLAAASKATIIGFHTKIEVHAEKLIKETKVKVKTHNIIYHAVDDVKELMRELLDKIPKETDTGAALVKATFRASQLGVIAGCQVTEGLIKRNHHMRILRDNKVVWKGSIASLKRDKEDVREVSKGYECGILLQNYNDVKEGDILQAYEITYLEQQL